MDDIVIDKIRKQLNNELVRRLLIKYFYGKGFSESFDLKVYPPSMQDIIEIVPELNGKVEVVPTAEEIDPISGYARLGWNLFVLGNKRMFLGYTEHSNLSDLVRATGQGPVISEKRISSKETTPRKIIAFICRILENSENGVIRYAEEKPSAMMIGSPGATFYRRGNPARFEH